jgi:hypothetical protein
VRYYNIAFERRDDSEDCTIAESALNFHVPPKVDTLQEARKIKGAVRMLFRHSVRVIIRSMDDREI